MSQHEYEALTEMSVNILDASPRASELDLRSVFYSLDRFQSMFDTGNTSFRTIGAYLRHRFFYQLEVSAQPDHQTLAQRFGNSQNWLENIYERPLEGWSPQNPVIAFWYNPRFATGEQPFPSPSGDKNAPSLFVCADSSLIPTLVARGALPESEAVLPITLEVIEVALLVTREAERQNEIECIAYWDLLLPTMIGFAGEDGTPFDFEAFKADPRTLEFRQIAARTGADQMTWNYGSLRRPTLEALQASFEDTPDEMLEAEGWFRFFCWWFRLQDTV